MTVLLVCLYFILTILFSASAVYNKQQKNKKVMVLNIITAICFSLTGLVILFK